MAASNDDLRSTNSLLADILDVLKRMDAHLKGQDERIGLLERTLSGSPQDRSNSSRTKTTPVKQVSGDSDSPTANSAAKKLVLKLNTKTRSGLRHSDELYGRRSSAWTDHQDVIDEIRRESVHGGLNRSVVNYMDRSHSLGHDIFEQRMWDTVSLPPLDLERTRDMTTGNLSSYTQHPPPQEWISAQIFGRLLDIQFGLPEAENLWNKYVGDSWTIPPDGRVEMSFQKHLLERLDENQAVNLLKLLSDITSKLEYQSKAESRAKRGSFRVFDFDIDPNYEESGWDYRAEFFTGMYRERPISSQRTNRLAPAQTASWKRIIEIRGLSRKLTDGSEVLLEREDEWPTAWQDHWVEAIPPLNSIFPFFTERASLHVGDLDVCGIINHALEHHQSCLPYMPSKEDSLCFHIVFYEVISLRDDEDLEDEMWKHGKLHSDDVKIRSRRLRESACTIVVIPDPVQPMYWTSLYLCPFNFDLLKKKAEIITTQDAPSVAADMIEFTVRIVINRWVGVIEYFAWLIGGHRDALGDPEVHDSLLFDDASFSRSRRYFWAINYLAELDESIASNILQLERWIAMRPQYLHIRSVDSDAEVRSLPQRLNELMALQLRLKALRQEAIALRDGLFSASGVIESRAATRLGENVKLLTFVSIFFLPLSFCMSIWSISDVFSLSSLAIVTTVLCCGTYFVVFNLNNIVRLSDTTYQKYKRNLVSRMMEDVRWSEQGKRFETFRSKAERVEPSNWIIGFFVLHKCMEMTGIGNVFKKKAPRKLERGEIRSEEHELDFSTLNGPRTAATGSSKTRRASHPSEHSIFLKGFSKLSFNFRRGAIIPSSTGSV